MKRLIIFSILFTSAFFASFSEPANSPRYSPSHPYTSFGGRIFFINASSYGLYWEIDLIDEPKGGFHYDRLCLEKKDIVMRSHYFSVHNNDVKNFDINTADPNNHFKKIMIYNMDNGSLLLEILPGFTIFTLKTGSIENDNAVFEALINDDLFSGGQQ